MPRNIDSTILAQLTAASLQPALFVMLTFASGPVYLWSGAGGVTWNGNTWTGIGNFLSLSVIENGSTVEARGITVTLSGLDTTLLGDVATEFQLGLPAAAYMGAFSDGALLPAALISWAGRMDQPTTSVDGDKATISIDCESRLIDLNSPSDRRYTQEDQIRYYPQDLGFSFVSQCVNRTLYWGGLPLHGNNV